MLDKRLWFSIHDSATLLMGNLIILHVSHTQTNLIIERYIMGKRGRTEKTQIKSILYTSRSYSSLLYLVGGASTVDTLLGKS